MFVLILREAFSRSSHGKGGFMNRLRSSTSIMVRVTGLALGLCGAPGSWAEKMEVDEITPVEVDAEEEGTPIELTGVIELWWNAPCQGSVSSCMWVGSSS